MGWTTGRDNWTGLGRGLSVRIVPGRSFRKAGLGLASFSTSHCGWFGRRGSCLWLDRGLRQQDRSVPLPRWLRPFFPLFLVFFSPSPSSLFPPFFALPRMALVYPVKVVRTSYQPRGRGLGGCLICATAACSKEEGADRLERGWKERGTRRFHRAVPN